MRFRVAVIARKYVTAKHGPETIQPLATRVETVMRNTTISDVDVVIVVAHMQAYEQVYIY